MLITITAAALLAQEAKDPSPSSLLTKCLARYAGAKEIRGTVVWKQTALGKTVTTTTGLQVDRPGNRFWISQARDGAAARSWLAVCDGRVLSYNRYNDQTLGPERINEPALYQGKPQTVPEMYLALVNSLGDLNPMVEIAFGNSAAIKDVVSHWATLKYRGRVKVRDADVHAISGDWREFARSAVSGKFEIYLDDDMNFVRYVETRAFMDPQTRQSVDLTSIWDGDLKLDVPLDESFFKIPK